MDASQLAQALDLTPTTLLTRDLLARATQDDLDPWHIGNDALYTLCRTHPGHADERAIIAKLWLIGRTYAAAIERRRPTHTSAVMGDRFYTTVVAPAIARSELDERLARIPFNTDPAANKVHAIAVHGYLVREFHNLTGLHKRSLASKYLHFHRPDTFFIYDDRAVRSVRRMFSSDSTRPPKARRGVDAEYSDFVHKVVAIRRHIQSQWGVLLTPRQIDRVFLALADRET